ncbi:hypothetical protein GF327_07670 [Candidatus Woesearchaeota archaeon]|nr:hypothetical protein [Candidatus Woesearchaeota archaeon]
MRGKKNRGKNPSYLSLNKEYIFLFLLVLVSSCVRLIDLTTYPALIDNESRIGMYAKKMINEKSLLQIIDSGVEPPWPVYLVVPSILFFGYKVLSLRIVSFIVSILSIILTYFFTRKYISKNAAVFAATLYAFSPWILYFSRISSEYSYLSLFSLLTLIFLFEYFKSDDVKYLYFTSLSISVGVNIKPIFLQFFLALIISSLIFYRKKFYGLNKKQIVIILILLVIPSIPYLSYHIDTDFQTFKYLWGFAVGKQSSVYIDNSAFLDNSVYKIKQATHQFTFLLWAAWIYFIFRKNKKQSFLGLIIFISLIGLSYTLHILREEHNILLEPIPQIIISGFIVSLLRKARRIQKELYAAFFILIIAFSINNVCQVNQKLSPYYAGNLYKNINHYFSSQEKISGIYAPARFIAWNFQYILHNKFKISYFQEMIDYPQDSEKIRKEDLPEENIHNLFTEQNVYYVSGFCWNQEFCDISREFIIEVLQRNNINYDEKIYYYGKQNQNKVHIIKINPSI